MAARVPREESLADPGPARPSGQWRRVMPELTDGRITLRGLRQPDAAVLCEHLGTPSVLRYLSRSPQTLTEFRRFVRWTQERRRQGLHLCCGIVPHPKGPVVGIMQIWPVERDFSTAEWGFAIGERHWGTELFMRSARQFLEFAFGPLGVHRLEARAVDSNARGNGALRKLGARHEGVLREAWRTEGTFHDHIMWSILATEWTATRERLTGASGD